MLKGLLMLFQTCCCARHMYVNLIKKNRSLQYSDMFWRIAKSTNDVDYNKYIKKMQELPVGTWEFLGGARP